MSVDSPAETAAFLSADRLLGADQAWIDAARQALAQPGSTFLNEEMAAALSQDTHRLRDGEDPMAWRSVWEAVATPLNDLLADLSNGRDTRDNLNDLLETFEKHGLISAHGKGPQGDPSARWTETDIRHQTTALNAATSPRRSGAFAAILIHVLTAGAADPRRTSSVSMPVLLHNEANARIGRPAGEVGTLTLTRWRGGPPGFHPDPRLMTFSTVDADALDAIEQAWLCSAHDSHGTCVTWAIRDQHDSPVRRLEGSSLAAALALLLHELSARKGARAALWRLRPRRLRADWTVTAGLRGRSLTRVSHYETKFEAVASLAKPLHVAVAPRAGQVHDRRDDPVLAVGERLGLDVRVIETYEGLSTATRTLNRGFALGLVGAVLVATAFTGVSFWAQRAIDAANLRADRQSAATELMQQSRSLIDDDSRLSALTALAADDLDPSIRTLGLMAEVLEANSTAVGSATVSPSYIRDLAVSNDTLLVLDGEDTVTAWSLPGFEPLGVVIQNDVSGLVTGGPGDVVIMKNARLHIFHTAAGYAPREVDSISTRLGDSTQIFGPYANLSGGVIAVDEEFNGIYYDNGMERPFRFSVGDNETIEADPRRASTTIVAGTSGTSTDPYTGDGVSEIDGVTVATSADQVLEIGVQKHYEGRPRPEAVVRTVMASYNAGAAIRAVSGGPNETVLLGTDRGVQQWDPSSAETIEFPYGGWSDQVDEIRYESGLIAVLSNQRIGFFDEPVDDRPRESPTVVDLGGSVFTTIESGLVSDGGAGTSLRSDRVFVGREDGTVSMLDPSNSRFGPGSSNGSNMQEFTPSGHLIQTVGDTAQQTGYLNTQPVPERAADQVGPDSAEDPYDYDPYQQTYTLPENNGLQPYINEAVASDDWIAAAGRRSDGMGAWWVWPLSGGTYVEPTEVPFGYGESGEDPVPDIVSQIEFVDGGQQVAAFNGAKGELGFWSVGDWQQVGSVTFAIPKDFDTSGAMQLVAAKDGRTVAVRDSDTSVTVVDTETHEVRRKLELPEAELADVTLSPDGTRLAVVDHQRTIRVLDATVGQGKIIASKAAPSGVNALEFDGSGDRLALGFATASKVEVIDAHTLNPLGPAWQANAGYRVIDVEWSPDGDLLSVGSIQFRGEQAVNGATDVLDPTTLTWREQLCQMATNNFTNEEWHNLSGSDLNLPNSCEWSGAGESADSPSSTPASPPSDTGDLTLADLMAEAPVPEMCGHEEGDLILGHLPGQAPNTGGVYLSDTAFGDLTGDGVADAVADIDCSAGGVGWPATLAAYTRAADGSVLLLGTISASDPAIVGPQGSERPLVQSLAIEDGNIRADVLANTEGDSACCGTLPVNLEMTADTGGIEVVRADRHYEIVTMRRLVSGITSRSSVGGEYVDTAETPPTVVDAIMEMSATYVGVEVGGCTTAQDLSQELATRVLEADALDPAAQYCTVVAAPDEEAGVLLLQLERVSDERWHVTGLIP